MSTICTWERDLSHWLHKETPPTPSSGIKLSPESSLLVLALPLKPKMRWNKNLSLPVHPKHGMHPQTAQDRGAAPLLWVLCNTSLNSRAQHTKFGNSYGYGLGFFNWKVQRIWCLNTNNCCFILLILTRVMKALFAALGARYFRWVFICIPHEYAGRINACHLKYTVALFLSH